MACKPPLTVLSLDCTHSFPNSNITRAKAQNKRQMMMRIMMMLLLMMMELMQVM